MQMTRYPVITVTSRTCTILKRRVSELVTVRTPADSQNYGTHRCCFNCCFKDALCSLRSLTIDACAVQINERACALGGMKNKHEPCVDVPDVL